MQRQKLYVSFTTLGTITQKHLGSLKTLPCHSFGLAGVITSQDPAEAKALISTKGLSPKSVQVVQRGNFGTELDRLIAATNVLFVTNLHGQREDLYTHLLAHAGREEYRGTALLVEKPLADCPEQLLVYRDLEAAGYPVLCGFKVAFHRGLPPLKQRLTIMQRCGYTLHTVNVTYHNGGPPIRDHRGGARHDLAPHVLSVLYALFDCLPIYVAKRGYEQQDEYSVTTDLKGTNCTLSCKWGQQRFTGEFKFTLAGPQGQEVVLTFQINGSTLTVTSKQPLECMHEWGRKCSLEFSEGDEPGSLIHTFFPQNFAATMLMAVARHLENKPGQEYPWPLKRGEEITNFLLDH